MGSHLPAFSAAGFASLLPAGIFSTAQHGNDPCHSFPYGNGCLVEPFPLLVVPGLILSPFPFMALFPILLAAVWGSWPAFLVALAGSLVGTILIHHDPLYGLQEILFGALVGWLFSLEYSDNSVSYTHLTLPTKA